MSGFERFKNTRRLIYLIVLFYAVSGFFLERTIRPDNPILKTALTLAYFSIWAGLLVYLWRKANIPDRLIAPILVLCLAVLYVLPLTTLPVPVGRNLPDVDFHAAKILLCSAGYFFNDPVTSYPSIYPPVYHIMVGSIVWLTGAANSWSVLGMFHVFMLIVLFLSVYLLAKVLFNPLVGILSVLFLGAIFDIPNQSPIFIPTPFLLGLTVIVNTVSLVYKGLQGKRWCFYLAGFLTGLAVTIWPAFLLVALILLVIIFFVPEKGSKYPGDLLKFALPFLILPLVVWIPQYLLLSEFHLTGTDTIGRFTGIPGPNWFFDLVYRFFLLGGFDWHQYGVTVLFGMTYVILLVLAILDYLSLDGQDLLRKKFLKWFLVLMILVLPVVNYAFFSNYTRRVQVLFNIPVIILAAHYLLGKFKKKYRILVVAFAVWAALFANGWNVYRAHSSLLDTRNRYQDWKTDAAGVLQFLHANTSFGDFIFSTKKTYRWVIAGYLVRFNLLAHRTGAYFSLNPELSEKMLKQYNTVLGSSDLDLIMRIFREYKIRYVIIYQDEPEQFPGLQLLLEHCTPAYASEFYRIVRCDESTK
jgi:hypothetical protein